MNLGATMIELPSSSIVQKDLDWSMQTSMCSRWSIYTTHGYQSSLLYEIAYNWTILTYTQIEEMKIKSIHFTIAVHIDNESDASTADPSKQLTG